MGANSPKSRDYFITINQGAKCYDDALEIVKNMNIKLYGFIVHDADVIVETDENGVTKTTPKLTHIHIMLELKNPVSFNGMQNRFEGAHIEVPRFKKSAYQYLIHNTLNSKEKYQYPLERIISNDLQSVKFAIESETFELFKENNFLRYIAEGTRTPYQFTKRFGLNAYRQYWKPYADMLENLRTDKEMQIDLDRMQEAIRNELPF